MTRVIFFQVSENRAKLKKIFESVQLHFEKKEALLIVVEDALAQSYVDDLLWKEGFLPHIATDEPSTDYITIVKTKKNLNQAKIAFNLCPTPLLIDGPFKIIYEFEDLTSPAKKNFSSLRFDAYKQAGYFIEAR